MSLLSFVRDPVDCFRPSLILDQHFGMSLDEEDLLEPFVSRKIRRMLSSPYRKNWRSLASQKKKSCGLPSFGKDQFQVRLDVQQFAPEELSVKVSENTITVEGKHEEKEDEHGFISRHFIRKYTLPEGHNCDLIQSKLSNDGVLTISAPKKTENALEREIPIAITGSPSEAAIGVSEETNSKKKKLNGEIKRK